MRRCSPETWGYISKEIIRLYGATVDLSRAAALAGEYRLFTVLGKMAEALLELQEDLEAWSPGECFDHVEFVSRLHAIERRLKAIGERLGSRAGFLLVG